ncbi:Hypothetical protein A7982_06196 [Minicystis rosea]|nr:Hypothetical protein A7982_06196 [Minicystis rosea]
MWTGSEMIAWGGVENDTGVHEYRRSPFLTYEISALAFTVQ